jgi:hypothetical protein
VSRGIPLPGGDEILNMLGGKKQRKEAGSRTKFQEPNFKSRTPGFLELVLGIWFFSFVF